LPKFELLEVSLMKLSNYLSIFRGDESSPHCAFNAMTGGIYKLEEPAMLKFEYLCREPNSNEYPDVKDFMIREKILIPEAVDELEQIKAGFRNARTSTDELFATFVLTDSCNFRCTYCYQSHDATHSTETSLDKGIGLIRARLPQYKKLKVHWFGGEPLLAFNKLKYAAEKLIALAEENSIPYFSAITSNGSLLTPDRAADLRSLRVDQIQITLDGDENDHNDLRVALSGKPTFETTLNAIKIAIDYGFHTFVRINLSPRNADNFPKLLDRLIDEGINSSKIHLYINEMKQHGHSSPNQAIYFSSIGEFGEKLIISLREMHKRGFPLPSLQPVEVNCTFDKPSSLMFGTSGDLYHCTTGTDRSLATLSEHGEILSKAERMDWVHSREPWDDDVCRTCKHLPLCMGGCAYLEEEGKNKCNPDKFVLEPLVKLITESRSQ
jgi:uncharacterized protein